MANKNITAFEAVLLQKIFLIEYSSEKLRRPTETDLKDKDYQNMATDHGIESGDTIKKIFGNSHHTGWLFQSKKLNEIVRSFKKEKINSWDDFRDKFASSEFIKDRERVPNGTLNQLNFELQKNITKAVRNSLNKFYAKDPKKAALIERLEFEGVAPQTPKKLKDYEGTKWYIYLCFELDWNNPKIVRSVIKFGNPANIVESSATNHVGFDNFSGTARLSEGGRVLILDMTSNSTQERELRIMMLINTGRRPDIALGEYMNIGVGGMGLHSMRVVMQYLDPSIIPKPAVLDVGHPEFETTPEAIKKYLYVRPTNVRLISGDTRVSTLDDLTKFIRNQEDKSRFKDRKVRLHKPFQIVLISPRYSVSEEAFSAEYLNPLRTLKQHLEDIKINDEEAFEVIDYYLDTNTKPSFPRSYSFYSDRIRNSEIVIALLFNKGSICESEITLAVEKGKTIHIFTNNPKELVPKILTRRDKKTPHIQVYDHCETPEEAVKWIIGDPLIFSREIAELKMYSKKKNSLLKNG